MEGENMLKPNSKKDFRHWCTEKWYEHRDEIESFRAGPVTYTIEYYFNQYKWWLKSEFKKEKTES